MVAPVQAFADILASNETFAAPMDDTYKLLDLNPADTTTLEQYLQVLSGAVWYMKSLWVTTNH